MAHKIFASGLFGRIADLINDGNVVKEKRAYKLGVLMCALTVLSCAAHAGLAIQGIGKSPIGVGSFSPHDLSGITYAGKASADPGSHDYVYYAVSNSQGKIYKLHVTIDPATGAITSNSVVASLAVASGTDLEGIVFTGAGSVFVCDEVGPEVREYSLADGSVVRSLTVPSVFSSIRANRAFESLGLQAGDKSLWTANEEALTGDGALATTTAGTTVRLLRYDQTLLPTVQYAYLTDSIESRSPADTRELSGVSDIAVMPNGKLLVLEREMDVRTYAGSILIPGFRNRIYEVDLSGATDVSGLSGLAGASYSPVGKRLLWEKHSVWDPVNNDANNYEGLTLGPQLADGSYSLLMISDDNAKAEMQQSLYALKLSGTAVPEPGSLFALSIGILATIAVARKRQQ